MIPDTRRQDFHHDADKDGYSYSHRPERDYSHYEIAYEREEGDHAVDKDVFDLQYEAWYTKRERGYQP